MSAISFFFYRPFRNASNYCADILVIPLANRLEPIARGLLERAEKMRPFANSLIGRIVKSAAAETACSIAGAAAGEMVVGSLCYAVGPQIVPAVCLIGLAGSVVAKKKPQIALFTIGLVLPAFFTRSKQAEYFVQAGEYAGRTVGTIVGGYVGLTKLAGAKIDLVNRTRPSDSYSVNMLKFQAAGEVFDAVIVRSSIPYAGALINLPRNAVKSVVQALAYNSQSSLPLLRKCLKEKRIALSIPQAVKLVCSRYSVESSGIWASQAAQLASKTIFPSFVQRMGSLMSERVFAPPLKNGIDFMAAHSGEFVSIFMRGLTQYSDLVQSIRSDFPDLAVEDDEDLVAIHPLHDDRKNQGGASSARSHLVLDSVLLKKALKMKIPGASLVSPLFDTVMKGSVQEWSEALIEMIGDAEKEVFGVEMGGEGRTQFLQEFLPIHLKYFLIYVLLHSNRLGAELTLLEERDFFEALNRAFFSVYTNGSQPHRGVRFLQSAVSSGVDGLVSLRKFFETTEEETVVAAPMAFAEDHFPPAAAESAVAEGVIAAQEDYF